MEFSIPCSGIKSNFGYGLFEQFFPNDSSRPLYYAPYQLDSHQFPHPKHLQHRQREFIAMAVYNCVRILAIASLEILTQLHAVYILYFSARKDVRKNIYTIYHILTPLTPLPRPPKNFPHTGVRKWYIL